VSATRWTCSRARSVGSPDSGVESGLVPHQRRPPRPDRLASSLGIARRPDRRGVRAALNRLGVELTLAWKRFALARRGPEARETLLRVLQHEGVASSRRPPDRHARRARRTEISWIGGSVTARRSGRDRPRAALDEADPPRRHRARRRRSEGGHPPGHHGPRSGRAATPSAATYAVPVHARRRPTRGRRWPKPPARSHRTGLGTWACLVHLHRSRGRRRRPAEAEHARRASMRTPTPSSCVSSASPRRRRDRGFVKVVIDRAAASSSGATIMPPTPATCWPR